MDAYYANTVGEFLNAPVEVIREALSSGSEKQFPTLRSTQRGAWRTEITALRLALSFLCGRVPSARKWGVLLEFSIPRRQRRIDAVVLARDVICVLEFKTGESDVGTSAARQVEDYALDLADFHQPSHNRVIVPIVVASGKTDGEVTRTAEWVQQVRRSRPNKLGAALLAAFESCSDPQCDPIDWLTWLRGAYFPVPTIIEAASALYAETSIREITHSHSGAENLTKTTDFMLKAVGEARHDGAKVICFVTGIPGAGKTLAGLNLAHSPEIRRRGNPASVFLTGNGPLVKILRAALTKDAVSPKGTRIKHEVERDVRTFIQNVHHFVGEYLDPKNRKKAYERVIVFDEAQRAWSAERNKKRYSKEGGQWHTSEPEMILRIMDRHVGWAVIVALVGGGQEINEGEAGLAAWGSALQDFSHWRVLASPEALDGGPSVAGSVLFAGQRDPSGVTRERVLHLDSFVRSPKAEKLADWVNRVLSGEAGRAAEIARTFEQFPIVLTRDIETAREWLRGNTRGERRCGLVASSGAARLRAFGIEISKGFRDKYSYVHWFLAPPEDTRSSFRLEVAASEFEIQGLELDNVAACWGGDFIWSPQSQKWLAFRFLGTRWLSVRDPERREQARNKYRVLLTRAREGLLVWVPRGDKSDLTQDAQAMDETADYLRDCGCRSIDGG